MTPGTFWIEVLAALLTPVVAIAGLWIGIANYRLAVRRRKDELFDRRYAFYRKVRDMWMCTGSGAGPDERPSFDWDDIEPFAHEALFLFGKDIADHLRSYAGKEFRGMPGVPDEEFAEPFMKYLRFEDA